MKQAEPPFYFLDGETLVRLISQNGDKATICFANMDVYDTSTVDISRLLNDKKPKAFYEVENLIVYIAGSVTSKGDEQAIKDFNESEKILRAGNFKDVINVFNIIEVVPGKTWKEYMVETYSLLLDCNAIYMQKGWQQSKGATIEHEIAIILDFAIFYE